MRLCEKCNVSEQCFQGGVKFALPSGRFCLHRNGSLLSRCMRDPFSRPNEVRHVVCSITLADCWKMLIDRSNRCRAYVQKRNVIKYAGISFA